MDAEVEARIVEIAGATPGDSFTDLAPLHAITTATIERVGVAALRYRPNLVIATPPGYPPYAENQWVGRELAVGRPGYVFSNPHHVVQCPLWNMVRYRQPPGAAHVDSRKPLGSTCIGDVALRRGVPFGADGRRHSHRRPGDSQLAARGIVLYWCRIRLWHRKFRADCAIRC